MTNMRVTSDILQRLPGLFHITTEQAFGGILREGIKAGVDLPKVKYRGGRVDTHLLTAPPINDQFHNERLKTMWSKGYTKVVIISVRKESVDLEAARINPQAVVLQ